MSQFPRPVAYNFQKTNPKSMGYSIRDDRYRLTQWVDFRSGKILAEEFYDYRENNPELKNQIKDPAQAHTVNRLKPKLQAFIQRRHGGREKK